jgi:hypothetical protein
VLFPRPLGLSTAAGFWRTFRRLHNQRPALKPGFNGRNSHLNLFEELPQILKDGVFFVRARAIGDKELLAQVQCLSLHCIGTKPIAYRSQESISVPLIFFRVPRVINRSQSELIERYFRVPIELRDRIGDQPVLREHDQIVGVHAVVHQVDYRFTLGLGEAVVRRFRFTEQFSE